jgi:hypothetical protein
MLMVVFIDGLEVVLAWARIDEQNTIDAPEFECAPKPIVVPNQPNSELVAFFGPMVLADFVRALDLSHML